MQLRITISALSFLALVGVASPSWAVHLVIQPVFREFLLSDQTPLPASSITVKTPERLRVVEGTGPLLVNVDYYVSISGLAGPTQEMGFGNVAFDILTSNLSVDLVSGGWSPDTTLVDTNGEEFGGVEAIWSDNGDFGRDGHDLKSIIVGLAPSGFGAEGVDPRRTIGQGTPAFMGSTVLNWDPATGNPSGLHVQVDGYSTYTSSLLLRERFFGTDFGGSLLFDVGPGQTGDTDADGDVDINDLNNVRNHFDETGDGVPGDTAPFDGVVDAEDLNRVRNNFGESVFAAGGMTAVPEPSSIGLAVLSFIALAGYRRGRR